MRIRTSLWYDHLYGENLAIMVGDAEKCRRWLSRVTERESPPLDPEGSAAARTVTLGGVKAIWFPRFTRSVTSIATLSHECFHMTDLVLGGHGLRLGHDSAEAYAYYIGWLMRECLTRLGGRKP